MIMGHRDSLSWPILSCYHPGPADLHKWSKDHNFFHLIIFTDSLRKQPTFFFGNTATTQISIVTRHQCGISAPVFSDVIWRRNQRRLFHRAFFNTNAFSKLDRLKIILKKLLVLYN